MEKTCRGCGETKLLSEYHKKKTGKYGRCAKCKECVSEKMKAYEQSEKRKAKKKAYNQSEAVKAALKRYRESEAGKAALKRYRESEAGKAKKKAYMKAYDQSEKRKAKKKAYMKAYDQSEKRKAYMKAYMKAYRESEAGKAYNKAYRKNRRHNDPVYKLQCNLRSGFRKWIKGNRKTCRTEKYAGCTYQELLDHLESQFEEGMTWENHGVGDDKWQIDHFKAQSRFDPTIEEEAFKCWHYTNLQPMWSSENIKHSNKSKPGDEFVIWMDRKIGWVNVNDVLNV
jgi:hypothetical protein